MNSYVCLSPAKMKPNKPRQKPLLSQNDTNPPNYKSRQNEQTTPKISTVVKPTFVNIHKQDNHLRLAKGFLT